MSGRVRMWARSGWRRLGPVLALALAFSLGPRTVQAVEPIDVQHVAITLELDWTARATDGQARLTLTPTRPISRLRLDAARLAIRDVRREGGPALVFRLDDSAADGALQIELDREAPAGVPLTLHIGWRTTWVNHSDPNNLWGSQGRGLRFFMPSSTEPKRRRQVWAGGEPGTARWWFPGHDQPHDLRTSELRITVPAPLEVVAGGRRVSVQRHADGRRTFHFRTDTPEPNHRTAFVVGEFSAVSQRAGALQLDSLGYPDERDGVVASTGQLPRTLRFLEQLTGQRYPHGRYTQVFVQDLPWNIPGTGLAVQTENMVDDAGTHHDFQYLWVGLQTESLAQQWFGGALPVCGWPHWWLDKAMAQHAAALYTEARHGHDEYVLWYLMSFQAATLADGRQGVRRPVVDSALQGPGALADFVNGNAPGWRGAAVLHMLRVQLGDAAWRRAIRRYARDARQAARTPACTETLQRAVEAEAGLPAGGYDWFFEQWVRRGGHPQFQVSTRHEAASGELVLQLRQTQDASLGLYQGPMQVQVDDRVHRLWLKPQAENVWRLSARQPPRLVQVDHGGAWIKTLEHAKTSAELLHQIAHTRAAADRQWAMTELVARVKPLPPEHEERRAAVAGLRALALRPLYWRVRMNALQQLGNLLAPASPQDPAHLDAATREALLHIVREERTWLRTAALRVLGASRDPAYAWLYLAHLNDRSDRVVNAAANALGASGSPLALEALRALPARPSWKNQSLISALNGLKALGDPRGADLALEALADRHGAHWTLATPVWDFRIAAAETLAALGRTEEAGTMILERFDQAMAEGEVHDIFSNVLLLVSLGERRAERVFPALRQRFAGDANALQAVAQFEGQLQRKRAGAGR